MDFDEKLIEKLKEDYIDKINQMDALETVKNTIKGYFKAIERKLTKEIEVSNGSIKFEYDINNNEIVRLTIKDIASELNDNIQSLQIAFIEKDKKIAYEWYKKAANKGLKKAILALKTKFK